jgi:hypothetical protein
MSKGSGGSDQFDDALNGVIGAMISGFETAVGAMLGIWTMMEARRIQQRVDNSVDRWAADSIATAPNVVRGIPTS